MSYSILRAVTIESLTLLYRPDQSRQYQIGFIIVIGLADPQTMRVAGK